MSDSWYAILTPNQRAGAIAMIMLRCPDPETVGISHVEPNLLSLSDLMGIDEGVVLGLDSQTFLLMPHGGIAIVRSICARLEDRGVSMNPRPDPVELYPETRSEIEAWCLHALSSASSPLAVDVLLQHNERWAALCVDSIEGSQTHVAHEDTDLLDRLIFPPTIAAVGRANVGKSSLINTLVGQQVALVADVAGTTRDHVGVPVDLGGLVVRWVDTPGVDERIDDSTELEIAKTVLRHADLIVHCIDSIDDAGVLDQRLDHAIAPCVPVVRLGTRSDLGKHECCVDLRVSVGERGEGIADMVSMLRERLLPGSVLGDPRPWRFWASLRQSHDRVG